MTTSITRTKAYKNLIALGVTAEQATKLLAAKAAKEDKPASKPEVDVKALADELGLPISEVRALLKRDEDAKAEPVNTAEALVEAAGLTYSKGRVYANKDVIEGAARVLAGKTGHSEIVPTSGNGHVKAVLVTKLESGDVSVQNLALAG